MYSNKKGITTSTITFIGVIVAGVVILIILGFVWKPTVEGSIGKETCRLSVTSIAARPEIFYHFAYSDLKCETEKIKIISKDLESIKEQLANKMYDCYWQYGEYKLDFTQKGESGAFCILCSIIDFETDLKEVDLWNHLKTQNPPLHNQTYWKIFYSDIDRYKAFIEPNEYSNFLKQIDTSKKLYTVFFNSPIGRITEQFNPGIALLSGEETVKECFSIR